MITKVAEFAMRGLGQSVLVAVGFSALGLLTFLFPLGIFGAAIVGLVVLRLGLNPAIYTVSISSVMMVLIFLSLGVPLSMGLLIALMQWMPVALLAMVLGSTRSWQLTVQAGLVVCLAGIVLVYVLVPDLSQYWQSVLEPVMRSALIGSGKTTTEVSEFLGMISSRMTGVLSASIFINALIALMMSRYMQAALYNPGGFFQEFREFRFGIWPAVLGLILVLLSIWLKNDLADALLTVLGVVYLVQGTAVIYSMLVQYNISKGMWIGLSVLFVLLLVPGLTILSGLGLADAFADFRRRFGNTA